MTAGAVFLCLFSGGWLMKDVEEIVLKQLQILQQRAEAEEITTAELVAVTNSMAELLSAAMAEEKKDAPASAKV